MVHFHFLKNLVIKGRLSSTKSLPGIMTFAVAKGIYLILLLVLLENINVKGIGGRSFTDDELERQLKILNKPYVKGFKVTL